MEPQSCAQSLACLPLHSRLSQQQSAKEPGLSNSSALSISLPANFSRCAEKHRWIQKLPPPEILPVRFRQLRFIANSLPVLPNNPDLTFNDRLRSFRIQQE